MCASQEAISRQSLLMREIDRVCSCFSTHETYAVLDPGFTILINANSHSVATASRESSIQCLVFEHGGLQITTVRRGLKKARGAIFA